MTEVISRKFLQVRFPVDPDEPEYGDDIVEATPIDEHNYPSWNFGAACGNQYITIWPKQIDAYIELLTAMKNYDWEEK